ncbi:helix-turn-helix domain-containing protein [Kineosporia babensis]|uniref:Helix-turn-helix transcriptional regulator n=1 Tax=Kineosporia babensis TaxID=499548 RepID=A0A9X1NFS4_9ACTN|nr:helix-turn-helix transcriptional regulator [Kineosporia babensis]MCD5313006.1 helix-turn-helix transcriptional regulator [Kineosporia babensis]
MDLDEMLGINPQDPKDRHARALVEADSKLLDDLIRIREEQGLSQTDVGRLMGISPSSVSRIESGERDPHLSTLRRYAMAVGATVQHTVGKFQDTATTAEAVWAGGASTKITTTWTSQTSELSTLVARVAHVQQAKEGA